MADFRYYYYYYLLETLVTKYEISFNCTACPGSPFILNVVRAGKLRDIFPFILQPLPTSFPPQYFAKGVPLVATRWFDLFMEDFLVRFQIAFALKFVKGQQGNFWMFLI